MRLRYAYFIKCDEVVKDAAGDVVELRCTYDPATRGGESPDGRKVKGTIHWVSAAHAVAGGGPPLRPPVHADPTRSAEGSDWHRRPEPGLARDVVTDASRAEPRRGPAGRRVQFERLGYFSADPDSSPARRCSTAR